MAQLTDLQCPICPHHCPGIEGKEGRCHIREFQTGSWINSYYGWISAKSVDPVEKKPLYHFYPGNSVYSIGFWGCNMRCPFCQNWQISQDQQQRGYKMSPNIVIEDMKRQNLEFLAFTYNEPLIHFEYVLETAKLAQKNNIKTILVSNGMLSNEKASILLPHLDACNIDLKSFNSKIYSQILGGNLQAVSDFIDLAAKETHLELTTLIVPGISDNENEMIEMASWIASVSKEIVYHLSAYFPQYKYQRQATTESTLKRMLQLARKYLSWVYPGNSMLDSNSYCPDCNNLLIQRKGYEVEMTGIDKQMQCTQCKCKIPVICK